LDVADVRVSIDATTATAKARVVVNARDVGTVASVYAFALAPRNLAKNANTADRQGDAKDDAAGCVLAQFDSTTRQLIATSASNLAAFSTGVLSAQGQAISVLNNVPTPQVAGASFFLGYGTDSATMISGWVNENVVTVPGALECPGEVPATPGPISGLWWNAAESGWGIHFTQRRETVFAAWFTYDVAGSPKWYVASNCVMPSSNATTGTCRGSLYEVNGPRFFGSAFNPSSAIVTTPGTLEVTFLNADSASMSYAVNGQTRTVPITRQPFPSGAAPPAINYTDLWWNRTQSGWGIAITHRFNVMFLAWYVYDAAGKPVWYVSSNCDVNAAGDGCSGSLFRTTGPPFALAFDPSRVQAVSVGTVELKFLGANNAMLSYTVDGASASKQIARQLF
jgi:hypothetical protein